MIISLPTPEAAQAAYENSAEEDRAAVDALGKELETGLHARQEKRKPDDDEVKAKVTFGPKSQRELVAKLYAVVKAKRKAQTDTVPETKAAPKTIEAPAGITVIQFERVVNFYPAD
jgi:hypothetical protein